MKILGITPIPTEKLFELRKECEALHARISDLLQLSYIDEPKEASSEAPQKASHKRSNTAATVLTSSATAILPLAVTRGGTTTPPLVFIVHCSKNQKKRIAYYERERDKKRKIGRRSHP